MLTSLFATPEAQARASAHTHGLANATLQRLASPAQVTTALGVAALRSMLDAIDIGMLACDEAGRVVHANAAAELELRQGRLLRVDADKQLGAPTEAQLERLLVGLAAASRGRHQLLELKLGAQRLALAIQPLALGGDSGRLALVLLGRRTMAPDLAVAMLCRLHDLTHAEQRVLSGLLKGVRVNQLALEHGVKVSTIRTQVATLRAKLGVRRMEDALRLVAELPPMAGALRPGALAA